MTLKNVKNAIEATECKQYLCSGTYCSEPIMTKDENGKTVDNFFLFSRSADFTTIEIPDISFGIYAAEKRVAYVNKNVSKSFDSDTYDETFGELETMRNAMTEYKQAYPIIREMFEGTTPRDDGKISEYLNNLEIISGRALYGFYQKLFPSFFDWAKN